MQITRCKIKEIPELQEFIHNHWKENHILSRNRELFNWQYVKGNKVNFIIAKDRNKIKGMLGFIPQNLFYKKDVSERALVIWTSMWRSIELNLGMSLLHYFTEKLNPKVIAGGNLSDTAKDIYSCLGYTIGNLNVFYMINQDKKEFKILKNFDGRYISEQRVDNRKKEFYFKDNSNILSTNSKFIYSAEDVGLKHYSDVYSVDNYDFYIKNRYIKHPVYNYKYIVIGKENELKSVIVYRIIPNKCIFIVDCSGYTADFTNLGHVFQEIMKENDVEYIVFMNTCWGRINMASSGFIERKRKTKGGSNMIIPTLFEPFKSTNSSPSYCYKLRNHGESTFNLKIHKGFGDFDRPNE